MHLENQTPAQKKAQPPAREMRTAALSPKNGVLSLRARHTDGGHEVRVVGPRHLELVLPDAPTPVVYRSKRQLLLALTGHDRHWTFERYFRIGRHAPEASPMAAEPAFDIMAEWGQAPRTVSTPRAAICYPKSGGTKPGAVLDAPMVKPEQAALTVVPESVDTVQAALVVAQEVMDDEPELGIDLVNRSDEVAKLLFAGFGQWIFSAGYDPDDVLQEVYKGLLARNRGKCPWDGKKSSFGHYVHMVCRGVLSNYHRKVKRRREFESSGVMGYGVDGEWGQQDVGSSQVLAAEPSTESELVGLREAQEALTVWLEGSEKAHTQDGKMAVTVLPMVSAGMSRAEIADELGVSRASVSRGLTYLREQARAWKAAEVR